MRGNGSTGERRRTIALLDAGDEEGHNAGQRERGEVGCLQLHAVLNGSLENGRGRPVDVPRADVLGRAREQVGEGHQRSGRALASDEILREATQLGAGGQALRGSAHSLDRGGDGGLDGPQDAVQQPYALCRRGWGLGIRGSVKERRLRKAGTALLSTSAPIPPRTNELTLAGLQPQLLELL